MKKYELIVDDHFRKIPTIASLGNRLRPNKDDIKYIRNVFALNNHDTKLEYINVFRIKALIDMPDINVYKGDVGGFVQSENNLSQKGNCWIFDDAVVCGSAEVLDAAQIRNNAIVIDGKVSNERVVKDNTIVINASIRDKSTIYEQATLYGSKMNGNAEIFGNAFVFCMDILDNAKIYDNAEHHGNGGSSISGYAKVYGNSYLSQSGYSWLHVSEYAQIFGHSYISSEEGRDFDAASGGGWEQDGCIRIHGDMKIYDCVYGKGIIRGSNPLAVLGKANIRWRFIIF